ncbi:MAG: serine/threonine-protein kinase [Planctomycetaceae bacterium]
MISVLFPSAYPVHGNMVRLKSTDELKTFLITSRLVPPRQWSAVQDELVNGEGVDEVLALLERRQILTSLQTRRILKGETEGLILGRYKLMYRNASGSFARVFRAEAVDDGSTVALKLLRDRMAADPEAVAEFHREARICQRFKHPNIVPIYDVGSEGNFHYFTMEFVEGGNLRDLLRSRQSLEPAQAARCLYEICAGLAYALGQGATHRDLRLTNVLMSSSGVAKLVDFGLAGADTSGHRGSSDDIHRALEYATLERGTHAPSNDHRSDLFFAGAILYELLSGEPPWPRTRDREERSRFARYTHTPPVERVRPNVPPGLAKIVNRLMRISPNERYQTAVEVMADLKAVLIELGEWNPGDSVDTMVLQPPEAFHLLVVDSVKKRIIAVTEYFQKHGFKVSFVSHPSAALERLKRDNPPQGLLMLADHFTDETLELFPQVQAYGRQKKLPCLAVFPAEEKERVNQQIRATLYGATAFQPMILREIRQHFQEFSMSSPET